MKHARTRLRTRSSGGVTAVLLACLGIPSTACGVTPEYRVPVEAAPAVQSRTRIAEEVGRLLGSDPRVSEAAAQRLGALDGADRDELLAYRGVIPTERDPRWLSVLERVGGLPALAPAERLAYARWLARTGRETGEMQAQSHLLQVLHTDPALFLSELAKPSPEDALLAITAGVARHRDAIPVLVARYRNAPGADERRPFAAALGQLVGQDLAPRPDGSSMNLERDARRIERWYQQGGVAAEMPGEGPRQPASRRSNGY